MGRIGIKEDINRTKHLFIVIKNDENEEPIFMRYKFWNMPYNDMADVQKVYKNTVDIINKRVVILEEKVKNGIRRLNNPPSKKENSVCHNIG